MSKEIVNAFERFDSEAPAHTILEVELEGLARTTRVLIDGEFAEFDTNELTWRAGAKLADQKRDIDE